MYGMGYGGMSQGEMMVHGGIGGACCTPPVTPVAPCGFGGVGAGVGAGVGVGIIAVAILILIALGVIF